MDRGSAAEFDAPLALMDREGSIFQSMCSRSGDSELLRKAASGINSKTKKKNLSVDIFDEEKSDLHTIEYK